MSPKNFSGNNNEKFVDPQRDAKLIEQLFVKDIPETILEKDMYAVDFNIACRTREDIYIPIEVGVVKFSIKDGVKEFFHDMIHPGVIPLGYGATSKDLSENYHGIALNRCGSKNYNMLCKHLITTSRTDSIDYESAIKEALRRIDSFIQPETVVKEAEADKPRSNVRPIFSHSREGVAQTEGCLRRLATETNNIPFCESFQVLDIVHMLKFACRLKDEKADQPYAVFHNTFFMKSLDPPTKKCCGFHFDIDNYKCSIGRAFAVTYCFLDYACPHYPVEATSKHLPPALEPVKIDESWQTEVCHKFSK